MKTLTRVAKASQKVPRKLTRKKTLLPDHETMVSFLINALYLVGNHRILVSDSLEAKVRKALIQIGHRIDLDKNKEPRAYQGIRYDRAVFTARALGFATEGENRAWLQAKRKQLQPGGLLCFHVFNPDQVWDLVEMTTLLAANGYGLERAYGDWTGASPDAAGARPGLLIVVASKLRSQNARRPAKSRRGGKI